MKFKSTIGVAFFLGAVTACGGQATTEADTDDALVIGTDSAALGVAGSFNQAGASIRFETVRGDEGISARFVDASGWPIAQWIVGEQTPAGWEADVGATTPERVAAHEAARSLLAPVAAALRATPGNATTKEKQVLADLAERAVTDTREPSETDVTPRYTGVIYFGAACGAAQESGSIAVWNASYTYGYNYSRAFFWSAGSSGWLGGYVAPRATNYHTKTVRYLYNAQVSGLNGNVEAWNNGNWCNY